MPKLALLIALPVAALLLASACGGGGDDSKGGVLLHLTPRNASDFAYNDLEALRRHGDLRDLLEAAEDSLAEISEQFHVDPEAVHEAALVTIDGDSNLIVSAELDRDDLIDALEEADFTEDKSDGVPVWEGSGYYEAVAFLSDEQYAFGYYPEYVGDIVETSTREGRSLADDDDIAAVFDGLSESSDIVGLLVSAECPASECRAWGMSMRRVESGTIGLTALFRFRSEDDAQDAEDEIEELLSDLFDAARDLRLEQDDDFVRVEFEMDVDDLVDFISGEAQPAATAEPTPTVEPSPIAPPSKTLGKIETSDGKYSITNAYVGDRWPQDCSGAACSIGPADCLSCSTRLKEGFQVVVVSVEPKFPVPYVAEDISTPLQGLSDLCVGEQEEQTYVVADDGSQTLCFSFTTRFTEETFEEATMQFTPPASAKGFTLFVPGNPPVDLGK